MIFTHVTPRRMRRPKQRLRQKLKLSRKEGREARAKEARVKEVKVREGKVKEAKVKGAEAREAEKALWRWAKAE